jgi:hypothetical protein
VPSYNDGNECGQREIDTQVIGGMLSVEIDKPVVKSVVLTGGGVAVMMRRRTNGTEPWLLREGGAM